MKRVNVVVEGQTEESFISNVLAPHLSANSIFLTPRCVKTGSKNGRVYRGGVVGYEKARNDINQWLTQDRSSYVTTMFDFYRLPADFPGYAKAITEQDLSAKFKAIQDAMMADIGNPRFLPYIQVHEYEAMLFVAPEVTDDVLKVISGRSQLSELQTVLQGYESPEHINGGIETAPSKRIESFYPGYRKPPHGVIVASRVGLD
jgi:hypothetical protein